MKLRNVTTKYEISYVLISIGNHPTVKVPSLENRIKKSENRKMEQQKTIRFPLCLLDKQKSVKNFININEIA